MDTHDNTTHNRLMLGLSDIISLSQIGAEGVSMLELHVSDYDVLFNCIREKAKNMHSTIDSLDPSSIKKK